MKRLSSIITCIVALLLLSCNKPEFEIKEYPKLESLENTLWYSYNKLDNIYYDIMYEEESGWMKGYSEPQRENVISDESFTYTFTPATDNTDGIINLTFEDGRRYGGILIPKGNVQIDYEHVYMIQLYGVDESGEIIYDHMGNVASSIIMWME